jgi:formate hydrogenlyase subunit 3/multisubunit Na+/H+ antiporter MnhD subunit
MKPSYPLGIRGGTQVLQEEQIKAAAFLTLALVITEILIEFLYKFSPNNLPQFLVVCVFSGFLSSWLIIESYSISKTSASKRLLLLALFQLIYAFSRELFLILNYQADPYHQYQNAIQRLDFKAFPFLFIYCIIFALQFAQILKLILEFVRSLDEDFQKILNSQPIALICFSRSSHQTIFINTYFKKLFGFNTKILT